MFDIYRRILRKLKKFVSRTWVHAKFESRFRFLKIHEPYMLSLDSYDGVSFGRNVVIGPFSELIVECEPVTRAEVKLSIGKKTWIGAGANIRAAGGPILIGDGCLIAQHVSLIAANHRIGGTEGLRDSGLDTGKVGIRIGAGVWIGAGATILPGVTIGDGAVVGAGSVVTRNVAEGQVVAGVPARVIRSLVS